ncbi:MAG TPA: PIN domain-containing protein [Burkholderiaceae bacterium]|nr:PIN domain-containing protein [Rubrivivax sp.]HRZ02452.1 PIN domain-containing protein [Burkholderiaceae bacterium]
MTLLDDTSVWSLALRRDAPATEPEVAALKDALAGASVVVTTGLVLQELLQGFGPPKARAQVISSFAALALIQPDREDHIAAAGLRSACRAAGAQLGTIEALIAQLCIRHSLTLLTTDRDFVRAAKHSKLKLWSPPSATAK